LGQLLLHGKVEGLDICRFEVFWQITSLSLGGGKVRWSGKVGLVTVLRPAEACRWVLRQRGAKALARCLVGGQGRVVVVRSVISKQSLAAHTEEVGVTNAVTTADDRLGKCLICESNSRTEVLKVEIDETAIGERIAAYIVNVVDMAWSSAVDVRSVAGSKKPVIRRIEVIELVVLLVVR
jgi:hypothetical protein